MHSRYLTPDSVRKPPPQPKIPWKRFYTSKEIALDPPATRPPLDRLPDHSRRPFSMRCCKGFRTREILCGSQILFALPRRLGCVPAAQTNQSIAERSQIV